MNGTLIAGIGVLLNVYVHPCFSIWTVSYVLIQNQLAANLGDN